MSDLLTKVSTWSEGLWRSINAWATSPEFYIQLLAIGAAITLAFFISVIVKARIPGFRTEPGEGSFFYLRTFLFNLRDMVFPILNIMLLGFATSIAVTSIEQSWLIRVAQSLAVIFFLYSFITQYVSNIAMRALGKWVGIPVATLHVFGWLGNVTAYLDSISVSIGDIHLTLYALLRTVIFGALLFWLGRTSNTAGKKVIRNQQSLDAGTKEVFAKLFEIALFVVVFLLLLQIMGINLTALAVFGGALGVGLGFGLQQIASNFISGIIILLDRSISIGDYIELADGRSGVLRELNMRFGVLETYDGKDIMVPNEQFITTTYTNWTHKDPSQRYSINFQVAYSTDLDLLFKNIRAICNEHPSVISGEDVAIEYRPDAEIAGFGDSGIDILVEFWMEGVDDGKNRVGADLMHSIWLSIQENNMQIPFPQREVRILNENFKSG